MQSTHQKIEENIKKLERGTIFFPEQFEHLGSSEAVRKALSRICLTEMIIRLSKGVYLFPVIDKELGILYPSVDKVAQAISERDRSRIIPTGIFALNSLGLSTQIPMKITYLTDGIPRRIKIGDQIITFKQTAPKNFAFRSKVISLIVSALKEIGKDSLKVTDLERIRTILLNEDKETIEQDAYLSPRWIRDIILSLKPSDYEQMD